MIFESYKELTSYIDAMVSECVIESGYSIEYAIDYSFHEYYYHSEEQYPFENLITITKCINLRIDNKIPVREGSINIFNKYVGLVDDKEYIASQLDAEEVDQLKRDVNRVKDYLHNLEAHKRV